MKALVLGTAVVVAACGTGVAPLTDTAVLKIDLGTNEVLQSIPVRPEAVAAREFGGVLWVTAFGGDGIWRLEP